MAWITISDEAEVKDGNKTADAPVFRFITSDFTVLKMFLNGKSIEQIASIRFQNRARVFSEIELQLRLIRKKLYPQIPDEFIENPFPYRKLWLNLVEDFMIYELVEDPSNIETVYFNSYKAKKKEEQMAMVDELRQYLN